MNAPNPSLAAPHAAELHPDEPFPEDPRFRVMRRLVNLLLIVMIAGVLTITIALLLKLRETSLAPVAGVSADERIVSAVATKDRVAITLRRDGDGAERVVVLDGRSWRPVVAVDDR